MNPSITRFAGVLVPALTPFDRTLRPATVRFVGFCRWLLAEGAHSLAVFGTTSEANSLSLDERRSLLERLIEGGVPAEKLMPGTGLPSLPDSVALTKHALAAGCGGVLVLPPYYYKAPSEEGLYRYFSQLIQEVAEDDLKIYLYHIPPVAQVGFSLSLIGRLIKAFPDTVVGLKDSSGDWSNTAAILDAHPGFEVFPGSEVFLLDGLRKGAVGCISATCNVSAAAIRNVFDNWQGPQADKLQADITALRKAIQGFPMIPALKALIAHYRQDPGWARLRPPFSGLANAEADKVIRTLAEAHGFTLDFKRAA